LTLSLPIIRWQTLDFLLYSVEQADAVECFPRDRRGGDGVDIEEFSSNMSPTAGFGDPVAGEQLVESGIALGMDDASEVLQVSS
jgi:hypothetical protein